ncbi:MAG: S8 family serine peptidase [Planctomycetota bacterium]
MKMQRTVSCVGVFLLAGTAFGAGAQVAQIQPGQPGVAMTQDAFGNLAPEQFVNQPGVLELTGQMIVRPRQDLYGDEQARFTDGGLGGAFAARGAAGDPLSNARARLLPTAVEHTSDVDEYLVSVPAGMNENTFSSLLMATGDYEYVEPNWMHYPAFVPNDPQIGQQYHHNNMDNFAAWDISTGAGITIAICDTGIDLDHPDFESRLVSGYNADVNQTQASGGDVDDNTAGFAHGSFCAGMAAAAGNNGFGTAGVAYDANLMPIKVSNRGDGTASSTDLTRGARWAVDNGARVINVSYSGVASSTFQTTGLYVENRGGLYLQSAGNDGAASLNGFDHENVIVVGATTSSNNRAGFSNTGIGLDIMAPGSNVRAAYRGGGTLISSGTSFSSPAAAGTIALMLSSNPNLQPSQVRQILYDTAVDLGQNGEDSQFGSGLVDSFAAVAQASGSPTPPVVLVDPQSVTVCQDEPVQASIVAGGPDLEYQWVQVVGFVEQDVSGQTTDTLTILAAQPSDSGIYFCRVTNDSGSVLSGGMQLTVDPAPNFTSPPSSVTIVEGEPFTLTANVSGADQILWLRNGSVVFGQTGPTYTIASASLADAGTYVARATNSCGTTTSSEAVVTVNQDTPDCGPADVNGDGNINDSDFFAWVTVFTASPRTPQDTLDCDVNQDGNCTDSDFFAWVTAFIDGC